MTVTAANPVYKDTTTKISFPGFFRHLTTIAEYFLSVLVLDRSVL